MIKGNYRIQMNFQHNKSAEAAASYGEEIRLDEGGSVVIREEQEDGCRIGRIHLRLNNADPLQTPENLAADTPVKVYTALGENPEKITAMYMYNPWWTRPAFIDDSREIPAKTQTAFFKLKDRCACLLPMAGEQFKTTLCGGTKDELCLEMNACSGGPVYVSDKIAETDPDVLRPLAYADGRLLMMNRSAKPTEDCMFTDPLKSGVLKLHNTAPWDEKQIAGGIAVCNLTKEPQTFSFMPAEIPDLEDAQKYWIFDYFGGKVWMQGKTDTYTDEISTDAVAWYVIIPAAGRGTCLGLLDKYVGFTAVESVTGDEKTQIIVLHETGTVGWACEEAPVRVLCGAENMTGHVRKDGALWTLPLPETAEKAVITVQW